MQKDMHYYGTYAMALAAGIPARDAAVIAYAAQFVDDSTKYDSGTHGDGGFLYAITTAHHPAQALIRSPKDHACNLEEQRKIWVPFHFFPGGVGETFQEKLLCIKDSPLVNAMLDNALKIALEKPYRLELMGICAHVYADTFSHYGFSGISSSYNAVAQKSFSFVKEPSQGMKNYLLEKFDLFSEKFVGSGAEIASKNLGHGAVATMPDRPYLHWRFIFDKPRPHNGTVSERENAKTFLEACEKLHTFFVHFAKSYYAETALTPFADIKNTVRNILALEAKEDARSDMWQASGLCEGIPAYNPSIWEIQKNHFASAATSHASIDSHIYRFHQAAAYHRYYVLKDLLPSHGIAVY